MQGASRAGGEQPAQGRVPADPDEVLAVLSRPDDPELAEVVGLAADLCGAEAAGLTVLHDGAYHLTVTKGVAPVVCAADDTFCVHTMTTDGVYFIEDAQADPRFDAMSWVDGTFARARFYASAPVYEPGGQMVGRLCVIDAEPRTLTRLQQRALEALAASVTHLLEARLGRGVHAATSNQSGMALMSHLAAELSHDLRVPLSSILASLEMLREEFHEGVEPVVGMLLHRATTAAERMSRMLEQVRHFGSVDDEPELRDVDLGKLVPQLLLDCAALLEEHGARVEIPSPLPVVRADPDEMYSLFQNLVTNSVKFARPEQPAVIEVRAASEGPRWTVQVSDNGIGIPEDRREDVFTLFSRVDPSRDGHGIGLATAARIVHAHGGRITAEESPSGGTTIAFDLPAT